MTDEPTQLTVAVWTADAAHRFLPTVRSLRAALPAAPLVVGVTASQRLDELAADEVRVAPSFGAFLNGLRAESSWHVLAVMDAVLVPTDFLDHALVAAENDWRVATVSFLSNAAGPYSFPHRGTATERVPDGADEHSLSRKLRTMAPSSELVSAPLAAGGAVLLGGAVRAAVGPVREEATLSPAAVLADFSLRARRRGFIDLLDCGTFISCPADVASGASGWPDAPEEADLRQRHPWAPPLLRHAPAHLQSADFLAWNTARAKVQGLRIVIQGDCLGQVQMGTQVQTLSLIGALAQRPDVDSVGVAVLSDLPPYAREILSAPKVRVMRTRNDDLSCFGEVDIFHRPYQPGGTLPVDRWRQSAARVLVTIQDLIAFRAGAYFPGASAWTAYRTGIEDSVRRVDGTVVISHDTREQMARECLPTEDARVFVIANGTDHLRGDEFESVPAELVRLGVAQRSFILVLGATYAHKNRDIAIRAWSDLRARGHDLDLVLVGALVPHGSSRIDEARALPPGRGVVVMPDVDEPERNWLLRHAALLLYPTSAEGFGLVPYEAARFGTPTVAVSFGPLREVSGEMPVSSAGWDPSSFARAAHELLSDPQLAGRQVQAALNVEDRYTWAMTAEALTTAYRQLLQRPAR